MLFVIKVTLAVYNVYKYSLKEMLFVIKVTLYIMYDVNCEIMWIKLHVYLWSKYDKLSCIWLVTILHFQIIHILRICFKIKPGAHRAQGARGVVKIFSSGFFKLFLSRAGGDQNPLGPETLKFIDLTGPGGGDSAPITPPPDYASAGGSRLLFPGPSL